MTIEFALATSSDALLSEHIVQRVEKLVDYASVHLSLAQALQKTGIRFGGIDTPSICPYVTRMNAETAQREHRSEMKMCPWFGFGTTMMAA